MTVALRPRIRTALAACAAAFALAPSPLFAGDPFLRHTTTVDVVRAAGPAVVNITTEQTLRGGRPFRGRSGNPFFDRFFEDFFEPRGPRTRENLGSGVVIDEERHVLTNEHVVGRADVIRVTLADGREFEAELVGADPNNDLAVPELQTDETVPWIAPGSSEDLMVGEPVIAIGNPFGLSNSVTTGVLSATNRSLRSDDRVFHGFLQTDASINPGNSGGPLLNAEGRLIGVNTAIYQGAQGIGFAIPIDVAKRVVRELITRGEVAPVWLGLDVQDLDARLVELLELPERTSGALVSRVQPDGPSAGGPVTRGDLITHVNGSAIRTAREFYDYLERTTPGESLELTLWRDDRTRSLTARTEEIPAPAIDALGERLLGLALVPDESGGYRVERVDAQSGAARIGLEPGDRVIGINGKALNGPEAYRRAFLDLRGRSRALLVVRRGRGRYHVTVPLS